MERELFHIKGGTPANQKPVGIITIKGGDLDLGRPIFEA